MFRTVHVLLIIAGLLGCPLNCIAQSAAVPAAARKTCSCCSHKPAERSPGDESRGERGDEPLPKSDEHGSCLCRGSVDPTLRRPLLDGDDLPTPCLDHASLLRAFPTARLPAVAAWDRGGLALLAAESGREVRVLIHSLTR